MSERDARRDRPGLDEPWLRERLHSIGGVSRVIVLETVDSTSDALRRIAEGEQEGAGSVVVADHQSAGRGRLGRTWFSRAGLGLYLSVLLETLGSPELDPRWALAAAVAACEACREVGRTDRVGIKWPNDLVSGRRKLAGVLADAWGTRTGARRVVVGIGVNVNHAPDDFPAELQDSATSLRLVAGATLEREVLAVRIVKSLIDYGDELRTGAWNGVRSRWVDLAPGIPGMCVETPRGRGTVQGIDRRGAILVTLEEGRQTIAFVDAAAVRPVRDV